MIEDKELGLKVAETPEEAMWATVKKNIENSITNLEKELVVNKVWLKAAEVEINRILKK